MSSPKKIWCFGDSLTQGSTSIEGRMAFSPYTAFVAEMYKARGSGDAVPDIYNHGIAGETSNEIATRFQRKAEGNIAPEDAVVILCGTNDVGTLANAAAEEVIKRIMVALSAINTGISIAEPLVARKSNCVVFESGGHYGT